MVSPRGKPMRVRPLSAARLSHRILWFPTGFDQCGLEGRAWRQAVVLRHDAQVDREEMVADGRDGLLDIARGAGGENALVLGHGIAAADVKVQPDAFGPIGEV